jgi:hypothetical protein
MSLLPLRLLAEPLVIQKFGEKQTFILPSKEESKLCIAIHDQGVVALVQDVVRSVEEIRALMGLPTTITSTSSSLPDLPEHTLIVTSDPKAHFWILTKDQSTKNNPTKNELLSSALHSQLASRIVVDAIGR